MWIVAKYDKKKANFFLDDLKKKLKDKVVIYNPKVKIEKFYKKKLISKEFNILGDYIFCFNPKFANQKILDNLQFTKGLKYFLSGFYKSQKEIKDFIKKWDPKLVVFVDSEIWPNCIYEIKKKNIPMVLLNARITDKTLKRWALLKTFAKQIFSFLTGKSRF